MKILMTEQMFKKIGTFIDGRKTHIITLEVNENDTTLIVTFANGEVLKAKKGVSIRV